MPPVFRFSAFRGLPSGQREPPARVPNTRLMPALRVTRHLDARHGLTPQEVLIYNLGHNTRMLANDQTWELLERFQTPMTPDPADEAVQRAVAAKILVDENRPVVPDFVPRLESYLRAYLGEHHISPKDGVLELLEQAEPVFRENDMPKEWEAPPVHGRPGLFEKVPARLIDFAFEHARVFVEKDCGRDTGEIDVGLCRLFLARPPIKVRWEQQICTPKTSQDRARRIAELAAPGSRVLVLGDDDLISLALAREAPELQIDVLEIDAQLVAFLRGQGGERVQVFDCDLAHGLPDSMVGAYDLVTTDPPYEETGMEFFLRCAASALKTDGLLVLSTYLGLVESPSSFWMGLAEVNFELLDRRHHFNRYIYTGGYRVSHLRLLFSLGCQLHPLTELFAFPYLYADLFVLALRGSHG